jgi:hypothetical protein
LIRPFTGGLLKKEKLSILQTTGIKLRKYQGKPLNNNVKEDILAKKQLLKDQAEKEILCRLNALRKYLRSPARDPHISLEEIFRQRGKRNLKVIFVPLMSYFHKRKGNPANSAQE